VVAIETRLTKRDKIANLDLQNLLKLDTRIGHDDQKVQQKDPPKLCKNFISLCQVIRDDLDKTPPSTRTISAK
jgi:hypothetical protein